MKKVKIPIEKAVGEVIPHDFTKIDPTEGFKGVYFKKGHIIREEDIEKLKDIGKNYIYKLIPSEDDVHEDEFASTIAPRIAGEHVTHDSEPHEGKIQFYASIDGLFKVDRNRLFKLNSLSATSFPTIHDNFPVKKGQQLAAFRIIPLYTKRKILEKALRIVDKLIVEVKPYLIKKANIIVTGSEIYTGRVKDKFIPTMKVKLKAFGVAIEKSTIVPDDIGAIADAMQRLGKTELLIVTGGSSVDPDDVTKRALKKGGVRFIREGNPIQPANNLSIGHLETTTVCLVPAGALFYPASAFDIFLPRILAKDRITRREIAHYALGGLCHFCEKCYFPVCPFGKA